MKQTQTTMMMTENGNQTSVFIDLV